MIVHSLYIQKTISGKDSVLHPVLIEINNKKYLIDCGYEETFDEFVLALGKIGVSVKDLDAILISHDDIDHVGALTVFKKENPSINIFASEAEAPYVSGIKKSQRLEQAEKSFDLLPEEHKPWALQFMDRLKKISRVSVDKIFKDNEIIEGDIRVIYTPGHTTGHVSFYIPSEELLIANDALVIQEGKLDLANPMFTLDMEQALDSVERIRDLHPKSIICYHGGLILENIDLQIADLLARYKN